MNSQTLPNPIPEWLDFLGQQGKSTRTVQSYTADLQDFAQWYHDSFGEDLQAAGVLPRDVEDFKAHLQTVRRAAPRTVNRRLAALSRFFKWAAARHLVRNDPTVEVRTLRIPPRQPKALTRQEEHKLRRVVAQAGNVRDIALVEVLLGTGVRVGELLDLKQSDVVLKARSGSLIVRRGKGGLSRIVPLTADVRNALNAYLKQLGRELTADEWLWQGTRGPLQDRGGICRLLEKYARWAGIDNLTPHVLRHTFATRYLESNPGDLRGLASILGHASLNTVMIYTEPREEDLLKRMERMGKTSDEV
jgi:integrase/recombinase XerD